MRMVVWFCSGSKKLYGDLTRGGWMVLHIGGDGWCCSLGRRDCDSGRMDGAAAQGDWIVLDSGRMHDGAAARGGWMALRLREVG